MVLGRDICGDWGNATAREWLVTNGLGGYACGTVAGANTRRYHGFLLASLRPPVERTLLVSKVDLSVTYAGKHYALYANEFLDGTVDPRGFVHVESFEVVGGIPVWRFAFADVLLEQRIFMAPGANTSYLHLTLVRAGAPLTVKFKPLVTYRDFHQQSRGARPFSATATAGRAACTVTAFEGARPFTLALSAGSHSPGDLWYWNFLHREEFARGLDALEDLWSPGTFSAELAPQATLTFTANADDSEPAPADGVLETLAARTHALVGALPKTAPSWVRTLAVAADPFIVQRGADGGGTSIIAGYPWFADWGRDTMISLPGLTTALGRHPVAADVLRTYAGFVDQGMLPNRFADLGENVEYNTADATLWMFQAVSGALAGRRDAKLLRDLYPVLVAIVHAHIAGTRYGIHVDPADGLLHTGEPGTQLTWMDAKHDGQVFTPRVGKPVEINALWLNALEVMVRLAGRMRDTTEKRFCTTWLRRAEAGFERFWNDTRGCLYDVLDIDGGDTADGSVRPNQIFAVSLPHCVLTQQRMRAVVDTCARELLTSYGLRSLSSQDPAFVGHYDGNARQRDGAYHQGTVWSWLLGPFALAHHRAYGDAQAAQAFLAPIAQHLAAACVGSVSEVFDGDAPHQARGCIAQAWSVGELLRAWTQLEHARSKS